jgi:flagellar motor switch protein FliG
LDSIETLIGARKAALFLMVMGEEFTAKVFKHLDDQEIKTIGEHMTQIKTVDPKLVSAVMKEFSFGAERGTSVSISGKDFLQRSVSKAFDARKADDLLEDMLSKRGLVSLEKLSSLSPHVLANMLMSEHPQTIALVLVNMKFQQAAEIIQQLPEDIQTEVVTRIADLDDVPNEIINEITEIIEEQLSDISRATDENLGGIQTAAEILNHLDHKTENTIFEKLETDREELAEEIRQCMFIFGDLITLDDRAIRALLKEISNDELILALKTAGDDLVDKILANVSQRAAQMMREDMEVMGPVRLRDVEQAQLNIIKVARRLAEEGKIVLGSKGGDDVLV